MRKQEFLGLISAVLLIVFTFPVTSIAGNGTEWARLKNKAEEDGSVNVIVQLQTSHPLDNEDLGSEMGQKKRQEAMQRVQDNLLSAMAKSGHEPNSVKQFKFIPFIAMNVDFETLESLQNDPDVTGIEEDKVEFPVLSDSVSLIGADSSSTAGVGGSGQAVAILDTGVDKFHSFFGGRVVSEACYSSNKPNLPYYTSESVCPNDVEETTATGSGVNCDVNDTEPFITRSCDHGTHVAGISAGDNGSGLTGVAPKADIIAIQVFTKFTEPEGCGSWTYVPCIASWVSDQIKGLERVLELGTSMNIASVNMSLGGGKYTSDCDADEPARKAAIDALKSAGIATVIASGNSSYKDGISAPACISSAVSVGSTTKSDAVSSFSNTATFLDILAPGSSISSSVPYGGYGIKSGTSMATPHTAGAWAVLKGAHPEATVDDILAALQNTGEPITDTRSSANNVFPRIQVDAALAELGGGGGNPPGNNAPNADAGPNQTHTLANVGDTVNVTLDGSGSSDPDGDPIISYTWSLPDNSVRSGVSPTITFGVGTYTIDLVVNDGELNSAKDSVVITVNDPDAPPPPTPDSLSMTPSRGLKSKGKQGKGPFTGSITYTLTHDGDPNNPNAQPINYSVSGSDDWVQVTNTANNNSVAGGIMSGSLDPGQSVDIMVDVSGDPAKLLGKGKYNELVTITNDNSGKVETRDAQLNVN